MSRVAVEAATHQPSSPWGSKQQQLQTTGSSASPRPLRKCLAGPPHTSLSPTLVKPPLAKTVLNCVEGSQWLQMLCPSCPMTPEEDLAAEIAAWVVEAEAEWTIATTTAALAVAASALLAVIAVLLAALVVRLAVVSRRVSESIAHGSASALPPSQRQLHAAAPSEQLEQLQHHASARLAQPALQQRHVWCKPAPHKVQLALLAPTRTAQRTWRPGRATVREAAPKVWENGAASLFPQYPSAQHA
mmetsp:Transcript_87624/g.173893  ORF Transcript_87624/g.173893 Transcript_87624/m.173893 type:complete len:245 (+) Transcript_87624:1673-2407(+)